MLDVENYFYTIVVYFLFRWISQPATVNAWYLPEKNSISTLEIMLQIS